MDNKLLKDLNSLINNAFESAALKIIEKYGGYIPEEEQEKFVDDVVEQFYNVYKAFDNVGELFNEMKK